jgi:glycosyltransferase involved in cell wall biosynthesis
MSDRPLVSIVTPSYNQAPFLEKTILSVINQDYSPIEYIVVDGGSTDGSVEIVRRYANRLAHWVSERDGGQSEAINKGFARSCGSILAWLNSDDVYLPGCVRTVVDAFMERPELAMVYGDVEIIDARGTVMLHPRWDEYDFRRQLLHRINIPQPGAFVRRSVLDEVGLLRTDLHYAMDFELWLRIGRRYAVRRIPRTLAQFRLHDVSKSGSAADRWGTEFITILDDVFGQSDLPFDVAHLRPQAYAGAYLHGASCALVVYDMNTTRRGLWHALQTYPGILARPDWWSVLARALLGRRLNRMGRLIKARMRRWKSS